MPGVKIARGMPGGTNTINNSSTFSGWLESTGMQTSEIKDFMYRKGNHEKCPKKQD